MASKSQFKTVSFTKKESDRIIELYGSENFTDLKDTIMTVLEMFFNVLEMWHKQYKKRAELEEKYEPKN